MEAREQVRLTDAEARPATRNSIPSGLLVALSALAVVFAAALLSGRSIGGLNGSIESISTFSGGVLGSLAGALPLSYAFGAGMVAAVNPCGFALLPAYLGIYLGDASGQRAQMGAGPRLVRAAQVSATVTAGFLVLFGLAGLLLSVATTALAAYFPWLGLAVGVLLVLAGGRMLSGGSLSTTLGERVAGRIGVGAHRPSARGYLADGLAYGAASLSCTLPIFLAVVASALTVGGFLPGVLQFVLYGLGMGFVITVLTLSTALAQQAAIRSVRRLGRYLQPVTAVLMILAGAYIVYYWLTLGGLLAAVL
jgi:cytochrome c biogenesis protein CcdA